MNGAQQRERFTAVSRAEKRLDDIETLLPALGSEMIADRKAREELTTDVQGLGTAIIEDRAAREKLADEFGQRVQAVYLRSLYLEQRTFWQRLRWIVRGV